MVFKAVTLLVRARITRPVLHRGCSSRLHLKSMHTHRLITSRKFGVKQREVRRTELLPSLPVTAGQTSSNALVREHSRHWHGGDG